jgi:hypothetical protein
MKELKSVHRKGREEREGEKGWGERGGAIRGLGRIGALGRPFTLRSLAGMIGGLFAQYHIFALFAPFVVNILSVVSLSPASP